MNHTVNRRKAMNASLQALKCAGVEGIMMYVWWGLVEGDAPGSYNWGGYTELLEMAKKHGLNVQAVMSFHQCGGNVGDSCSLAEDTNPAIASAASRAISELKKQWEIVEGDRWRFMDKQANQVTCGKKQCWSISAVVISLLQC